MFQKNDIIELQITDMTNEGEGVGKADGFTFFVKDTIVGDEAKVRVTKLKKTYGYGRLEELIVPSKDRIIPRCPKARQCGGCQIQAMTYESQLRFKESKVRNNLIRLGGFEKELIDSFFEPIIGGPEYEYRNKAQFPFGTDKEGNPVCGFYAGRTHSIISNTDCALGVSENREILERILEWMRNNKISSYDEVLQSGLVRHALIRKGFNTGEIMVCLVINGESIPKQDELIGKLKEIKGMKSISLSVNKNNTNVIMGDNYKVLWGSPVIEDILLGLRFKISPLSFYQVNPVQVEKLYQTAIDYAQLSGKEEVWDLCCGIGTITLSMASAAGFVHGIEIVPQAIEDAQENAGLNGVENVEFLCAPVEEYLPEHANEVHADVVVMDPPRKGMDEKALEVVVSAAPDRIVYVSCDSATLARDLKYLCANGYELKRVRPVDMFPQTVHVETVVLLGWKGVDDYMYVDYAPDHHVIQGGKATYKEIDK